MQKQIILHYFAYSFVEVNEFDSLILKTLFPSSYLTINPIMQNHYCLDAPVVLSEVILITILVHVLALQGHVSAGRLIREGHVRASRLRCAVFSVSAPWFTPPADVIVTVMTVLTLPPAPLSLLFPLSFRLCISFAHVSALCPLLLLGLIQHLTLE